MNIINNQSILFLDSLKDNIDADTSVRICTNCFTINAIYNLIDNFEDCSSIKLLINKLTFESDIRKFVNDTDENQTHLKLTSYYRLNRVRNILSNSNIEIREGNTGGQGYIIADNMCYMFAPNSFSETTLGVIKDGKPYGIVSYIDESGALQVVFDNIWHASIDIKSRIINLLEEATNMLTPHLLYQYSLASIFENKSKDDINEDRLTRTGFKNSKVWNMLYNFQRDAVLGAIDKIETYNGCIIADSVGLGKTFEALAVIKYYELRNDRVLVLAPKKLRENWTIYTRNDTQNILASDRFNFDVLNHTDLSREGGHSGDINLKTINWGNYDLVVIDESHNFRNNNPAKGKRTRYEKLLEDIIQSGVKTKVLMLSATPVNTRLNDLKNQIYFITEANDVALADHGIPSIGTTLRNAQTKFNSWMKYSDGRRDTLIESLSGDYFKLLDIYTISRSRKHIEKYYNEANLGKFPTRLKPISINTVFDSDDNEISIKEINSMLEGLNLKFYSPLYFLLDPFKEQYEEKYDTITEKGSIFKQLDREENVISLMRVNLLKRMESSIHSFRLTLNHLIVSINNIIEKIEQSTNEISAVDISDLDFEDSELSERIIGGKVKVLIEHIDKIKLIEFLREDLDSLNHIYDIFNRISVERDSKLNKLKQLIENKIENPINPGNRKVIIFSAFADTIEYLYKYFAPYLKDKFGVNSAQVVGGEGGNKTNMKGCDNKFNDILINFSPTSKHRESIFPDNKEEIDILFCTDCISEGQNLQDCDYLVNYDIHWNPVRIVQRFGRIDRIGSKNEKVQLVNFYPDIELDEYIDLVERVKGRMKILDISATGDEDIIDEDGTQNKELEYRKRQMEKMRDTVVDLEDLEGGISISDLTFNDFKVDSERLSDEEFDKLKLKASGLFSLVHNNSDGEYPSGALFCLKDLSNKNFDEKLRDNLLHPYCLVYISNAGDIQIPVQHGKRSLDLFKKLAYNQVGINRELLSNFNNITKSGRYMDDYTNMLSSIETHLSGKEKESIINSIFEPSGSAIGSSSEANMYEVISYLITY